MDVVQRKNGRSGGIRTPDPLLPKQMRYQAALHSDDKLNLSANSDEDYVVVNGRSGGIRTPDPLLPKQMRYQAALHSDATHRDDE